LVEAEGSFTTFHSGAEPPDTELAAALPPIDQARCYIDGHLLRFGDLRELLQLQGALQGHGEQQEEGNEGEEDEDGSEVIKKLCEKVENFVRFVGPAAENVILAIQH
jgi:hypothetical protein